MAEKPQTLDFKLVSPEAILFDEEVELAVVPGTEGEFGIGPGHAHLIATLGNGVVRLFSQRKGESKNVFIAGGFADVNQSQCRVLAEQAVNLKDINQEDLRQELSDLHEDLDLLPSEPNRRETRRKITIAEAKLYALQNYG